MAETHRDANGRLLPGHPGISPGRPPRSHEESILETIRLEATPERVQAVLAKLYEQATTQGSVRAAALWLAYTAGKPQPLDPRALGQDNIELVRKMMVMHERLVELEAQAQPITIEVKEAR